MFTGTIQAKLDAKGRVFFPASFRKQLGEDAGGDFDFVLKRDVYAPCMVVYPRGAWEEEWRHVSSSLNRWNPTHATLLRQFMSDIELVQLDANGRFIVPKRFLNALNIKKDVAFIGMGDRIEMWDAEQIGNFVAPADYIHMMENLLGNSGQSRM